MSKQTFRYDGSKVSVAVILNHLWQYCDTLQSDRCVPTLLINLRVQGSVPCSTLLAGCQNTRCQETSPPPHSHCGRLTTQTTNLYKTLNIITSFDEKCHVQWNWSLRDFMAILGTTEGNVCEQICSRSYALILNTLQQSGNRKYHLLYR